MAETRDPRRLCADGKAAVDNSVRAMFARAVGTPRFSCRTVTVFTPLATATPEQAGPAADGYNGAEAGQRLPPSAASPDSPLKHLRPDPPQSSLLKNPEALPLRSPQEVGSCC